MACVLYMGKLFLYLYGKTRTTEENVRKIVAQFYSFYITNITLCTIQHYTYTRKEICRMVECVFLIWIKHEIGTFGYVYKYMYILLSL